MNYTTADFLPASGNFVAGDESDNFSGATTESGPSEWELVGLCLTVTAQADNRHMALLGLMADSEAQYKEDMECELCAPVGTEIRTTLVVDGFRYREALAFIGGAEFVTIKSTYKEA